MTATRPESIPADEDRSVGEALDIESFSRTSVYNVPGCKPAPLERVYHCNGANVQFEKLASTRPRRIPRLMSLLPSRFQITVLSIWLVLKAAPVCLGQQSAPQNIPPEPEHKRIFGIIPNYRTYPTLSAYQPITPRDKFKIAVEDSFDRGTVILAAAFAGQRQLTNNTPAFGQGVAGYVRYFGAAYADVVIGNFMTEAIYPVSLHEDPRYFRRGAGSGWSRAGYAMTRIFWTRMDSGRHQFNFSEVVGNSTAVAISSAYYPDNRTAGAAISSLAVQLGVDMAGNFLKEFWPDLSRKLSRKHKAASP